MSRSNLYRLFDDTGGVARYIRRERLLEARAVLSNPSTTQSISAITEDLCFADASSFSRAFKREFGIAPAKRGRLRSLGWNSVQSQKLAGHRLEPISAISCAA
jgi:AraC-like DNA-binding protein